MKINYNGTKMDATQEIELFPETSFGFTVTVSFTDTPPVVFNNATGVHVNYNPLSEKRVAIESDIHQTGNTFAAGRVTYLQIIPAIEIEDNF